MKSETSLPMTLLTLLSLLSLLLFCLSLSARVDAVCSTTIGGKFYDLSSLTRSGSSLDFVAKAPNGDTFYINFCGRVSTELCPSTISAVCGNFSTGEASAGSLSTQSIGEIESGTGIALTYSQGANCPGTTTQRQTTINVVCDRDSDPGVFGLVTEDNDCVYIVEFQSIYGCPTAPPPPTSFPNITSVFPNVVSLAEEVNITISLTDGEPISCPFCSFNVSGNIIQIPVNSYDNTTASCPFPIESIQPGVVDISIYSCQNTLVVTNALPIYAYDEPPSIVSVNPENIIATGMNATVTIKNPIPFAFDSDIFCYLENLNYPFGAILTDEPNVVICPFPAVPIGTGNLSIAWDSPYSLYLSTKIYQVTFEINRVLSISPSSACVLGGTNITLTTQYPTAGSSPFGPYCMFSNVDNGELVATSDVLAFEGNTFICAAIPWGIANEPTAAVSLIFKDPNYLLTNPMPLSYYSDCALSVDPATLCSISSSFWAVTVNGQGFPPSNEEKILEAVLWPTPEIGSYPLARATVVIQNSSQLSFVPDTELYHYDQYYLQIASTWNYDGNSNVTSLPLLEIRNSNNCISAVNPDVFSYNGGDLITVTVAVPTFIPSCGHNYYCYNCVFVDPLNIETLVPAMYESSNVVTCMSPPVSDPGIGTLAIKPLDSFAQTDTWPVKWVQD